MKDFIVNIITNYKSIGFMSCFCEFQDVIFLQIIVYIAVRLVSPLVSECPQWKAVPIYSFQIISPFLVSYLLIVSVFCACLGCCSSVADLSVVLGYSATSLGCWFPMFWAGILVSFFRVQMLKHFDLWCENTTMPWNTGNCLPSDPAVYPRIMETTAIIYNRNLQKKL